MYTQFFYDLFINRGNHFSIQTRPSGVPYPAKQPVTDDVIDQHLLGYQTMVVPVISLEQTCKWIDWDCDCDNGDYDRIYNALVIAQVPTYKTTGRPGRPGHIFVFFKEPIAAPIAHEFANKIRMFAAKEPDKIDIFPAQANVPPGGVGNICRLPLGYHAKAKDFAYFDIGIDNEVQLQLAWLKNNIQYANVDQIMTINKLIHLKKTPRIISTVPMSGDGYSSVLALIPDWWKVHQVAGGFRTKCPVCKGLGKDNTIPQGNLSISADGKALCCHRRGCNDFAAILDAFRQLTKSQVA